MKKTQKLIKKQLKKSKETDDERMKTKNFQVRCPHCGKTNTVPETASISITCSRCGKNLYTEGIDVMDKASSKVYNDFDRQRKEEIEADKEKD